jgi:hypothetical protein
MGINIDETEMLGHIKAIKPEYKEDEIDYELFVRVVALSLELKNFSEKEEMLEEGYEEDMDEEKRWYNQQT